VTNDTTNDDATAVDKSNALSTVKALHDRKRELEAELMTVRYQWREAMVDARNKGVTVSDISREIGVVAPNIFRTLRDGK